MSNPKIISATDGKLAHATNDLLPLVYDELRRLAASQLSMEHSTQTLQPTALVHEAYLRLAGGPNQHWDTRAHFFTAAAEAMRRILIENARRKGALKRGGDWHKVDWDQADVAVTMASENLLALSEAIEALEKIDADASRLVRLRFFTGLTHQEAAEILGVSRRVADRLWAYARAWLHQAVQSDTGK